MEKIIKVNNVSSNKSYAPGIKLSGKYLEKFNFYLDDIVFVNFSNNKIIIQKATKKQLIHRMASKNEHVNLLISKLDLV